MANCGCTDTTPCGTQECGCKFEVDAGCVRYTGDALSCIDAQTGDRLSDILIDLNAKFCDLVNGTYIEVSQEPIGVNCTEGGLKIVVKDIRTEAIINTEYLCTAATFGIVTGLNTDNTDPLNPVIRVSVDGTTITGLGTPASPLISTSVPYVLPTATNSILGGVKVGTGLSIDGSGVLSSTYSYTLPIASSTVLGGIKVGSGLSVDGSGILTAASNITGTGSNNYLARWTPNGTTLGIGLIRDDGNNVGVNAVPLLHYTFRVTGTEAHTITGVNSSVSGGIGVYGIANGTNSSINYGGIMQAYGSTNLNIGTKAEAIHATVGTNIGLYGVALLGSSNYAAQFFDGTQGIGKVLTCVTADGKANWVDSNLQKVITATYVLTDADHNYTIFIDNNLTAISISLGTITIPNFCVGFIQEGSADVTFSGSGLVNSVGFKLKGYGYQTLIERKLSTTTYYLLGNTKA